MTMSFCSAVVGISRISMTRMPSSRSLATASRRLLATAMPVRIFLRSRPSYLKRATLFRSLQIRLRNFPLNLAFFQKFLHGSLHHVHTRRPVGQDDVRDLVDFFRTDQVGDGRIRYHDFGRSNTSFAIG